MNWSRDYFAIACEAARAIRALDMRHESLRSAVRIGAQTYDGSRGGFADPQAHQASMDALLDFERDMPRLYAPHDQMVADALGILYGSHGRGGVAAMLDGRHADAVNWRWLQLRRWREIAADLGCTVRRAQQMEAEAFDFMDETGEDAIRGANEIDDDYFESMRDEHGEMIER